MVKIRNLVRPLSPLQNEADRQEVKYGVISTTSLQRDLGNWETLYISGRLQKPHLPLLPSSSLSSALETNKKTALCLALILLGDRFTEYQLWEKIAGISYAGDPRMSIPGAENPEKVRNIVRGQGALEGFRAMYGTLIQESVGWEDQEKGKLDWQWKGQGDDYLIVRSRQDSCGTDDSNRTARTTWLNYSFNSLLASYILLRLITDLRSSGR